MSALCLAYARTAVAAHVVKGIDGAVAGAHHDQSASNCVNSEEIAWRRNLRGMAYQQPLRGEE